MGSGWQVDKSISLSTPSGSESSVGLSFSDLLFWAVLVGDRPLAQCLWEHNHAKGDPIRMALLSSQAREICDKSSDPGK